jgi:hypothetical protein
MSNEELIEYSILWFEEIVEKCDRMTTGNFSHDNRQLKGFAQRCADFIKIHHKVKEE